MMFGIGTRRAELFMDYFPSPYEIYKGALEKNRVVGMLSNEELSRVSLAMEQAASIKSRTEKKGCTILTPDDADYPELLRGIYSRPSVLYVKGDLSCLSNSLMVAMVGSREHTEYGKKAAELFACGLAKNGAVVVSGLAPGIDSESHRAALETGGKTIGILGCGIDVDYPAKSRTIKTAASQNGAVITEFPLGTQPRRENFPLRNRIISGISHCTLVVEADLQSGSLITARTAREQGRQVFAVPGPIFSKRGQGTNKLLKEGALLAEDINDILNEFSMHSRQKQFLSPPLKVHLQESAIPDNSLQNTVHIDVSINTKNTKEIPKDISQPASLICQRMGRQTLTVDELVSVTGLQTGELLAALTELEIFGLVQAFPGRKFKIKLD